MARVVYQLPFFDQTTTLTVAGETVPIKRDQIIVWVSLGEAALPFLHPNALRIPAILDTGLAHNFAIREEHLLEWAGLHPQSLPVLGHLRLSGLPANLLGGHVWVYRNQPRERDLLLAVPPFRLELDAGLAVYPRGTANAPRLPILGLRALRRARLHLTVDADRCLVYLRTPRRFWFFG
jgi:hypothetical protein